MLKNILVLLWALMLGVPNVQASGVSRASNYNPAAVAITGGTIGVSTITTGTVPDLIVTDSTKTRFKNTAASVGIDIGLLGGTNNKTFYIINRENASVIIGANNTNIVDINSTGVVVTGTLNVSSSIISDGVINGSAAAAGKVGEVLSCTGSGVNVPSGAAVTTICSIALGAGVWELNAMVKILPAASTSMTSHGICVHNLSGMPDCSDGGNTLAISADSNYPARIQSNIFRSISTPVINQAGAITHYCTVSAIFTVSTVSASCTMKAYRIR